MNCLRWPVVLRPFEVPSHIDCRVVADLFAPLTNGALCRTAGDGVIRAAIVVAFPTKCLLPFLPCSPIARAGGAHANVHGIGISKVLEGRHLM